VPQQDHYLHIKKKKLGHWLTLTENENEEKSY